MNSGSPNLAEDGATGGREGDVLRFLSLRLRRLHDRAAAAHLSTWSMAARIGASGVRRRLPGLRTVAVPLHAHGPLVLADLSTPMGRALYRYGFSPPEVQLVRTVLRPGDVFIDGGAHIGMFTLVGAAAVGRTGRVIACEPVPENVQLLKANLDLNRFEWVDIFNGALAEHAGTGELFSFGAEAGLSSFAPATQTGTRRLVVDLRSLDELGSAHLARVRLVKLDIEGAEVKALSGAVELLRSQPDFLVEVEREHLARQGSGADEMHAIFSGAGYTGYEIQETGSSVVLVRLDDWTKHRENPNVFVSARPPSALPCPLVSGPN